MVALADLVVSVKEVAVIVTVPPAGTVVGAVYVVPTVNAVPVLLPEPTGATTGLKEPHTLPLQLAVQMTPALAASFATRATRPVLIPLTTSELGTGELMETAIGRATIVTLALLLCEGLAVTLAVIVTVAPMGTAAGEVNTVAAPSDV